MSRKKDIQSLLHIVAALRGISEEEAGRQLARDSARKLRWRRQKIEHANRPVDPDFMRRWEELEKQSAKILAETRLCNHPEHPTVQ